MASLQAIQGMVKKAEEAIGEHNNDCVRMVYWPDIKDALNEDNPPDWLVRNNMRVRIHNHLDEAALHAGVAMPIDVEQLVNELKIDLQAGKLQKLEPPRVVKWLPF